jgi:hypothetical protein
MAFGQEKPVLPKDVFFKEGLYDTLCVRTVKVTVTTGTYLDIHIEPWRRTVERGCKIKWMVTENGTATKARIKLDHPGHFVGGNPDYELNPETGPLRDTAPVHVPFGYSIEFNASVTVGVGNEARVVITKVVLDPEYERDDD